MSSMVLSLQLWEKDQTHTQMPMPLSGGVGPPPPISTHAGLLAHDPSDFFGQFGGG